MSADFVSGALRRVPLVLMAALLAACQPASEPAQPETDYTWVHEVSDLPADPAIRYGRLGNGLRYAIRENDTPPNVASVRLVFNVGSLAEAEDQRGLAHFIEHMAFNGSTDVPEGEMVPLLERHGLEFGPDTNAFTGYETVGYQLDIPEVDEETVDTALFLMRQTASELLMDSEAIDRERGVILSEERYRNTPIRRWNNALWRFRLPDTIVPDRDAIGTVEVIETAPRERLVDYYENFYTPERAMLVVVGDIDPDVIEAKIADEFAGWEQPDDPRGDPDVGTVSEERPLSVGYFHDPEIYTIFTVDAVRPHEPVLDTAQSRFENNLANLGDAILSRRFATLTSSGTSPLIQASANHTSDFDVADRATVLAIMRPDQWQEGVAVVEQELRRAIEHGFTEAELAEQEESSDDDVQVEVERVVCDVLHQHAPRHENSIARKFRASNCASHPCASAQAHLYSGCRARAWTKEGYSTRQRLRAEAHGARHELTANIAELGARWIPPLHAGRLRRHISLRS